MVQRGRGISKTTGREKSRPVGAMLFDDIGTTVREFRNDELDVYPACSRIYPLPIRFYTRARSGEDSASQVYFLQTLQSCNISSFAPVDLLLFSFFAHQLESVFYLAFKL